MSLPDSMIVSYIENVTDVPDDELDEMKRAVADGSAAYMDIKKHLARELVAQFHDAGSARAAEQHFERTVQGRETPDDLPVFQLPPASELAGKRLSDILTRAGMVTSAGDAKRLIDQGAVRIDDHPVDANLPAATLQPGSVIRAGRRRFVRLSG